ncbi:MAG: LysR family transcriptional regulator [Mesorhizobium sp.]
MDLKSFDLNLLRALEALLSEGQVSAAARRLNLSQPATSAALARLRAALGDPLLVRSGNRMLLTALAEEILPKISTLLAGIETALNPPRAFYPSTSERTFRILANDYAAEVLLSALVERLRRSWPGLTLEILPLDENFGERLAAVDYDLAIRDQWSMRTARHIETLYKEVMSASYGMTIRAFRQGRPSKSSSRKAMC